VAVKYSIESYLVEFKVSVKSRQSF